MDVAALKVRLANAEAKGHMGQAASLKRRIAALEPIDGNEAEAPAPATPVEQSEVPEPVQKAQARKAAAKKAAATRKRNAAKKAPAKKAAAKKTTAKKAAKKTAKKAAKKR